MASKHALRLEKDGPHVLQCWALLSGFVLGWDSPEAVEIGRPIDTLKRGSTRSTTCLTSLASPCGVLGGAFQLQPPTSTFPRLARLA